MLQLARKCFTLKIPCIIQKLHGLHEHIERSCMGSLKVFMKYNQSGHGCRLGKIIGCLASKGNSAFSILPSTCKINPAFIHDCKGCNVFNSEILCKSSMSTAFSLIRFKKLSGELFFKQSTAAPK